VGEKPDLCVGLLLEFLPQALAHPLAASVSTSSRSHGSERAR